MFDDEEYEVADWRDSAPIEYITESEYFEDDSDDSDPDLDGWDEDREDD